MERYDEFVERCLLADIEPADEIAAQKQQAEEARVAPLLAKLLVELAEDAKCAPGPADMQCALCVHRASFIINGIAVCPKHRAWAERHGAA